MNFIQHYKTWRNLFTADERITPQHVSLYLTLFDLWNINRFRNPIVLYRSETMFMAHIGSTTTYLRCLKELTEWGYIKYMPSHNMHHGSKVTMLNLEGYQFTSTDTDSDTTSNTTDDTTSNAARDTIGETTCGNNADTTCNRTNKTNTNNTNCINSLNNGPDNESSNFVNGGNKNTRPQTGSPGDDHSRKKEKLTAGHHAGGGRPDEADNGKVPDTLEEATAYFLQIGSTAREAQTFFSHYKSLGWKINGAPVEHWQALADKWLIKSQDIAASKHKDNHPAGRLHVETNKNYAEPL